MRTKLLLLVGCAVLGIAAASCKGPQVTYASDASLAGAADDEPSSAGSDGSGHGDACGVPPHDNGASIGACSFAAKFVDCTLVDGSSSGCLSKSANSCAGLQGATCVSKCGSNQYAVSCGGPSDGGVAYDPVPSNCEVVATAQNGKSYACCSCDPAN